MKVKRFTLLQLYSIVDGRMSTNLQDVYDMLNHITGISLQTHHIPIALQYIKDSRPLWYIGLKEEIDTLNTMYGNNFERVIQAIKDEELDNIGFDIPELNARQKEEFLTKIA